MSQGRLASAPARLVAHLLLFVLLGPPVGSAAFLVALGLWAAATQPLSMESAWALPLAPLLWMAGLLPAYTLGAGPAAAAGALVSLLPRTGKLPFTVASAGAGGVAAAVWLHWTLPPTDWRLLGPIDAEPLLAFVVAGAAAAAVSGRLAYGVGPLWRGTPYRVGTGAETGKSPAPVGSGADPGQ